MDELRVGMLKSLAAGAETVKQMFPGMEIVLYDTMPECVGALRSGKVDALLHNSYVWSYVLQKPSYKDMEMQPTAMFSMDFRAGTPDTPEGRAIIERLNEGIAALKDTTSSVKEQYETASVTCEVAEDFTVKNTGNIPALIRVSVVVNRVNEAGNVIPDTEGLPAVTPADGWMELDGYLYCKTIVQPGEVAPAPVNLSAGEGVQVVILAEAIQATPAEALAEAWGAVYEAGSWSAAEP
jgi:hypothetical protein